MALLFAAWWLLVLVTGARLEGTRAVAVLAVAIAVLAVGECLYDSVQGPLVSGLAPDGSIARYLAVSSLGWQLGFIVAPAVGGVLLAAAPLSLPAACAALCLMGAAGALGLEQRLPERARVTPVARS